MSVTAVLKGMPYGFSAEVLISGDFEDGSLAVWGIGNTKEDALNDLADMFREIWDIVANADDDLLGQDMRELKNFLLANSTDVWTGSTGEK